MNLNTEASTTAWRWFAEQRFKTDQHLLQERVNKARREVLEKIKRDFQYFRMAIALKATPPAIWLGVDEARGPDRTVIAIIHKLPWEGRP